MQKISRLCSLVGVPSPEELSRFRLCLSCVQCSQIGKCTSSEFSSIAAGDSAGLSPDMSSSFVGPLISDVHKFRQLRCVVALRGALKVLRKPSRCPPHPSAGPPIALTSLPEAQSLGKMPRSLPLGPLQSALFHEWPARKEPTLNHPLKQGCQAPCSQNLGAMARVKWSPQLSACSPASKGCSCSLMMSAFTSPRA